MDREQVYTEMKETLGLVPSFFKLVPDKELGLEWELFKKVQLEEGYIPQKYRDLIGLAMSAATRCRYCTFFHSEAAKLEGATNEEIEEAMHFAKSSAGWSTYLNGMQLDLDTFKSEFKEILQYLRSKKK